ncbi:DUF4374 domain-containing protein [Myroides odoratimimus]|uniref:DUF4374 domain-containing protein n=1 Tax=Myroides odoratimimus CCUG 10230 TaxID=883150 RepID=A0ABN0EE50_9FLAO|nr:MULTISPECIES: DUF4374 domain-containing protein [Myroides]AJA69284.1 Protein of unknown function DUF4374 [Myroides sp. A21]EHO11999.1 hypothetical protein HMPREF9712_00246 [Myroides odoratimimus CCUG 10230]EHO13081.1 hypothetical protein HMPREF9714_01059 [Myroides odoratimimus CCUG 12901]MDM1097535.1 DUF4374 domain-containing protein [Myroides odoratimimus]MDM1449269.1 DUF4374 domain-containing protein [Myroides odoratimimus]
MKKYLRSLLVLGLMASIASCSSDDNSSPNDETEEGGGENQKVERFVIAASSVEHTDIADYLLTVEDIEKGSVSLINNGIEQDGAYRYYLTAKNKFYSLLYGQGNPGAVTAYALNKNGKLEKTNNFVTETVQVYGAIDNDFVMWKVPRSGVEIAPWYIVNTDSDVITKQGVINTVELANNGERAHFSGLTQIGNKLVAPYFSMRGITGDVWGTSFPNTAWAAVYEYPSMKLEKVIKSDKSSYIGGYFKNGLIQDEKGDGYAFSSANVTEKGKLLSKNPSGILKIDGKTLEFDNTYFWDIEKSTNGYFVNNFIYAGKGNFIARLENNKLESGDVRYASLNVYTKTFKWVEGLPEGIKDLGFSDKGNYAVMDGKTVYVGVTTKEGSFVYKMDAEKGTATKGIKVEGGTITAITKVASK